MNAWERAVGEAAIRTYGRVGNILKAVEELAELQQALCKHLTGPADATATVHVYEEIADVEIMVGRLKMLFDPDEIQDWKDGKLDRTAERLGIGVKEGNVE